jgi:hypothetical protein
MKDLRKAAEMVLEVYDNDYGDIAKKIALSELRQALAQPKQEPAQNMKTYEIVCPHCDNPHDWTYLQREWVGLTYEEVNDCLVEADPCECLRDHEAHEFAKTISEKLKEKNT